jgi:predicted metal-binding membrane protein
LLVWDTSPYARYLNHGDWAAIGLGAVVCASVPGGAWLVPVLLDGGGWLLMSAAMMLPTSLRLIRLFDRMISGRSDWAVLHGLLIAGYLLAGQGSAWPRICWTARCMPGSVTGCGSPRTLGHPAPLSWAWRGHFSSRG